MKCEASASQALEALRRVRKCMLRRQLYRHTMDADCRRSTLGMSRCLDARRFVPVVLTGGPSSTKYARSGDSRPKVRSSSRPAPGVVTMGSRASGHVSSAPSPGLRGSAGR